MLKSISKIFWMLIFCALVSNSQTHPVLFFGNSDKVAIQAKINASGYAQQLWTLIKERQADFYSTISPDYRKQLLDISKPRSFSNLYSLAFVWFITGNNLYRDRAREIIFGYTGQVGLLDNSFYVSPGNERVLALTLTTDILWDQFTSSERDSIFHTIKRDLDASDGLRNYAANSNNIHDNNRLPWFTSALLFTGIVFNGRTDYPEANSDISLVKGRLLTNLDSYIIRMFDPNGAPIEGTLYGPFSLDYLIPCIDVLNRTENRNYFNDEPYRTRLTKFVDAMAYEVLPVPSLSRQVNNINDAYRSYGSHNGIFHSLLQLSGIYNNPTALWFFNSTVINIDNLLPAGISYETDEYYQRQCASLFIVESILHFNNSLVAATPNSLPKSAFFYDRGLSYIRTSNNWADANDIQFSITSSPAISPITNIYSIKHDQVDKNSITLSAFGKDFILDNGYGCGLSFGEYHNYILIDNNSEAAVSHIDMDCGYTENIGYGLRNGKIVKHIISDRYDYIFADATGAFNSIYGDAGNGQVNIITSVASDSVLPH